MSKLRRYFMKFNRGFCLTVRVASFEVQSSASNQTRLQKIVKTNFSFKKKKLFRCLINLWRGPLSCETHCHRKGIYCATSIKGKLLCFHPFLLLSQYKASTSCEMKCLSVYCNHHKSIIVLMYLQFPMSTVCCTAFFSSP